MHITFHFNPRSFFHSQPFCALVVVFSPSRLVRRDHTGILDVETPYDQWLMIRRFLNRTWKMSLFLDGTPIWYLGICRIFLSYLLRV